MPKSDETKESSVSSYLRTGAFLALAMFNIWHIAEEQAEKKHDGELLQIKQQFAELAEKVDAEFLRKQAAKSQFDLFYEQSRERESK